MNQKTYYTTIQKYCQSKMINACTRQAFGRVCSWGRLADSPYAQQRQNDKDHGNGNKNKEQDLGYAGCACGYAGEAENTGYQGNDGKNNGPLEHRNSFVWSDVSSLSRRVQACGAHFGEILVGLIRQQKSQPSRIGFSACLSWLLDLGSNQGPTD